MPPLFIPEIETLAEKDPLMYEILYRIQAAISSIPIISGGVTPTPTAAIDPASGLPIEITDDASASLPSAAIDGRENALYIATDPLGNASGAYIFGGKWQKILAIVRPKDLAKEGPAAKTFLLDGDVAHRGGQFDEQGRIISPFFLNAIDALGLPLTKPLTQSGTTTTILVAATTWQFGGFQLNYNSGSVDPGAFGTYNVFFDDPKYRGGTVVYLTSAATGGETIKEKGRFFLGQITTVGGGGGIGDFGGSGGSGGSRYVFY